MSDCKYLYANDNKKYFLRLEGNLSYVSCAGFKSFTDKLLNENLAEDLYIDLSETNSIDSTNLGILAKCALYFVNRKNKKPVIYSSNSDINTTLTKNGFESIFEIIDNAGYPPKSFNELMTEKFKDREGLNNTLLDAHEVLSQINSSNQLKYKDVLQLLRFKNPNKN